MAIHNYPIRPNGAMSHQPRATLWVTDVSTPRPEGAKAMTDTAWKLKVESWKLKVSCRTTYQRINISTFKQSSNQQIFSIFNFQLSIFNFQLSTFNFQLSIFNLIAIRQSLQLFFLSRTTSYRILPHLTAFYRFLPHFTETYRMLPIRGSFAVARTANDRITNGKRTVKCKANWALFT